MDELTGGLDPVDRVAPEEEGALRCPHYQAAAAPVPFPGVQLLQQGQYAPSRAALRRPARRSHCSAYRVLKPVLVDRLEQVIDHMHFEGAKRVMIVRGDENDRRLMRLSQRR